MARTCTRTLEPSWRWSETTARADGAHEVDLWDLPVGPGRGPLERRARLDQRTEGFRRTRHRVRRPDLALADNLDVVENMYLGRETLSSFRRLDEAKMEAATRKVLRDLSVTTLQSVRLPVAAMSGGQRQSVVAKAVLWNSKLVVLDEPTAALGVAQTRQVLDLTRRLADQGLGVILISHNMSDGLRGRRRHHRAAAGTDRGRVQAQGDDPARSRGGDHRRPAPRGPRHGRGDDGMSASTSLCGSPVGGAASETETGQRVTLGVVRAPARGGAARGRARVAADRARNHRDRDLLPGPQLELPDRGQLREPDRADGRRS